MSKMIAALMVSLFALAHTVAQAADAPAKPAADKPAAAKPADAKPAAKAASAPAPKKKEKKGGC